MKQRHRISRRRFLFTAASTSLAASTSFAATGLSHAGGADDVLRLGLVGCGRRGLELLSQLSAIPSPTHIVAAVCDVHPGRRARACAFSGARDCAHWRDLVQRSDIDAVIVATPDHTHAAISIAAMEAGKDVYCERPMALEIEEARAFCECAARTSSVVQIGAQEVSNERWRVARQLAASGAIGDVIWCQADYPEDQPRHAIHADVADMDKVDWEAFLGNAPRRSFDAHRYVNWRNYWDYSHGVAAEIFHDKLAALLMATGPALPVRVSAAGGIYAADGREVPDSFVMSAEYAGGHRIVLASSPALRGQPAVIRGSKGSIDIYRDVVRITREGSSDVQVFPASGSRNLLEDWLMCIRTRTRCTCDVGLGYQACVAMAMAAGAYRRNQTLCLDEARSRLLACAPRSTNERSA